MKPQRTFAFYWMVFGIGFLVIGFGLGLLFEGIEVQAEGPAGVVVAVLFGMGLCSLLISLLLRMLIATKTSVPDSGDLTDKPAPNNAPESSILQAKFAICLSAATTLLAFGLFFGGI